MEYQVSMHYSKIFFFSGIISRLDHLSYIGIGTIWVSPIFPSPMKDFGYDVSDFKNIDPTFGTLDDFDELIKEVHNRGENLEIIHINIHM